MRRLSENAPHSNARSIIRAAVALGHTARSSCSAQAFAGAVIAAIALSGLSGCSFDSAPGQAPGVEHDASARADGGNRVLELERAADAGPYAHTVMHGGRTYVLLDGGLYELQRDDGGKPSLVEVDAGGALEPELGDSGSSSSSADAGDHLAADAGVLDPDAGSSPAPMGVCTATCVDGSFKCPSSSSSSGFVCRSWPPCYCPADGGAT
ncbi:MAG: hypothetical protein ACOYD1_12720 [Candidatus Nanopelagicales bacterium]